MSKHRTTVVLSTVAIPSMVFGFAACVGAIGTSPSTGTSSDSRAASGSNGQSGGSENNAGGPSSDASASSGNADTGSSPSHAQAFACTSTAPDPGPTSLLMLTRAQYLNTLQSLFGAVIPDLTSKLGPDDSYQTPEFGLVQADVDLAVVQSFQASAEAVAAAVVGNAASLTAVAACPTGTAPRTCAQTFVQTFGALAHRAPITDPADTARHLALYDVGATTSYAHGIEMVLRGMLQSPRFLYRVELGTTQQVSATAVKLSGYERAARLAYDMWNTLPDAQLVQAAASGDLDTTAGISAQLTRMLEDPKGATVVRRFLEGLTQLSALPYAVKDATVYPAWNVMGTTLPASMQSQADAFFDDLVANQGGTISALLTSTKVFANADLAPYYGVNATGVALAPVQPTIGQASGVLTLPAFLTLMAKPDESWPIYRGKWVRQALLCRDLPAPPPNIPPPPQVEAGVSTRQRLSEHETNPSCSSCHSLMDPIGFGFENFDGVGKYRTTDGNQPVDSSGTINATSDINGPFNGVVQLGQILSGSSQVQQCFAQQWFRFVMSRYEQDPDNCSMDQIFQAFQSAGLSLNALPQAIAQSDAFLYRRPIVPSGSDAGASDASAEVSP